MSRFDFEKMLAAADVKLTQEQTGHLHAAMDRVIDDVELEAKETARNVLAAELEAAQSTRNEAFDSLAALQAELKAMQDDVALGRQAIADERQAALGDIGLEAKVAASDVRKLRASRVAAELAWNDLPKKVAIGAAAFLGLIVGAGLTILAAASERRSINSQIDFAQMQVTQLQQYVEHWEQTAGFALGQYRGDPVVRLNPGQEFVRFVPPIGASTAGNLWKVEPE